MTRERVRAIQLYFMTALANGHPAKPMTVEIIDDILALCCQFMKDTEEEEQ